MAPEASWWGESGHQAQIDGTLKTHCSEASAYNMPLNYLFQILSSGNGRRTDTPWPQWIRKE